MRELVLASDWRRSRENTRLARHLVPQCGPHIKSVGVRTRENRAASPEVFEDCDAWPMRSLRRQFPRGGTLPTRPPLFYLPGRSQRYGPKNQTQRSQGLPSLLSLNGWRSLFRGYARIALRSEPCQERLRSAVAHVSLSATRRAGADWSCCRSKHTTEGQVSGNQELYVSCVVVLA